MTYLTETHERDFLSSLAELGGEVQDVAVGLAESEAHVVLKAEAGCRVLDLTERFSDDAYVHEAKLALRRALASFVSLED